MDVDFADDALTLIETDRAGETRLSVATIGSARRKLTLLRAATDDRSLKNWKSLRYEECSGDRGGYRSIRLNDEYRLVFSLDKSTTPETVTILGIESDKP